MAWSSHPLGWKPPKILGSESFARWLVSLALALELVLELDIEHYHITASVIWLAHCHHISQSFDLSTATTSSVRASASTRARASASARDRASTRHRALPYHHISQSFDLPPAITSVSHLTCPLPPHHQSELVLVLVDRASARHRALLYHHISQSFDLLHHCITALQHQSVIWLAPTTTSVSHLTCPLPPHQSVIYLPSTTASLHYHISQSFTCPLPPHQSVFWLALYHRITASLHHCITTSVSHLTCPLPPHHQSFDFAFYHCIAALPCQSVIWLAPTNTSVSHLTCPLPPHQSVIWLAHCNHIIMSPPPLAQL